MNENVSATAGSATNLTEHPAAVAWKELNEGSAPPRDIQVLRRRTVYRLIGAGPERSNVIAKRCLQDGHMVEQQVYADILPHLTVSSPSYYGHVKELKGGGYWLFIEDAGDEAYSPRSTEHQALVSKWLAELHTSASRLHPPLALPDCSAGRFHAHLRWVRGTIQQQRSTWAHLGEVASIFEIMVSQCDELQSRWHEVQSACELIPLTLVHCDLAPKNMCVRSGGSGKVLLPFDWEMAGWGNPATDIAQLVATPEALSSDLFVDPEGHGHNCGIEAYWTIVQEHWRQLNLQMLKRLALVGQIFRMLLSVRWALEGAQALMDKQIAKLNDDFAKSERFAIDQRCANDLLGRLPLYQSRLACLLSVM